MTNGRLANQLPAKHETMNKIDHGSKKARNEFILPPAYRFDARQLWGDLRLVLAGRDKRHLGYRELGKLMGKSRSTAHYWFSLYRNPGLRGFMTLLEHLEPEARQSFITSHCRELPTLSHPRLAHAASSLEELLGNHTGMTIIVGGTDEARTFVLTALGHEAARKEGKPPKVTGIDLHSPTHFVPVTTLRYIDESLDAKSTRELVLSVRPKILTSRAQLLLFNGVWTAITEIRTDLLVSANRKHVVLAEPTTPDLELLRSIISTPIHLVTLSVSKLAGGEIRLFSQQVKSAKGPKIAG
jgi:hypothetical protein